MWLGTFSGYSASQALLDNSQFLKVPAPQLQSIYLDPTQAWSTGMLNASYILGICSNAAIAHISVPMVIGYGPGGSGYGTSPQGPTDSAGTGTAATLTITASSGTGFTFRYNSGAVSTVTFPYNATASQIAAALNSTAGISGATATLSPNNPGVFLITFPLTSAITPSLLTTTVGGTLTAGATMWLSDVGSGTWNTLFTQVFTNMVMAHNPATNPIILRFGWEMYGSSGFGWPWCTSAQATNHKNAWITLVGLARAVSSSFKFDWGGGIPSQYNPITGGAWPGASYVDYITADVYENQGGNLNGAANWAVIAVSLVPGLAFAQAQGKLFGIPEFALWGVNGAYWGDDPAWIEASYYWMRENEPFLAYMSYFNNPGSTSLSGAPNSGAVFTQLFGGWAPILGGVKTFRFLTAGSNRLRV